MNGFKKVILVEDNPADVELTKLAFKNLSIETDLVHCSNGKELLSLLGKEHHLDEICYILLDLNMPVLNGIEVLKIFHKDKELRKLPVIVFTSSMQETDIQTCYALGANAYVLKPMSLSEFDATIKSISEFWGDVNVRASVRQKHDKKVPLPKGYPVKPEAVEWYDGMEV